MGCLLLLWGSVRFICFFLYFIIFFFFALGPNQTRESSPPHLVVPLSGSYALAQQPLWVALVCFEDPLFQKSINRRGSSRLCLRLTKRPQNSGRAAVPRRAPLWRQNWGTLDGGALRGLHVVGSATVEAAGPCRASGWKEGRCRAKGDPKAQAGGCPHWEGPSRHGDSF